MTDILRKLLDNLEKSILKSNKASIRKASQAYPFERKSVNLEILETKSGIKIKVKDRRSNHILAKNFK